MKLPAKLVLFGLLLSFAMDDANAQPKGFNYDESKVPEFKLPDPLVARDGSQITTQQQWITKRRPELLRLFEDQMYGRRPGKPTDLVFEVTSTERGALNGMAIRKQVTIHLLGKDEAQKMDVLIYLPADASGPVPTFVGYNFYGNHTINADPEIRLPTSWVRNNEGKGSSNDTASEAGRGTSASRSPRTASAAPSTNTSKSSSSRPKNNTPS